jgi:hypothetical protein
VSTNEQGKRPSGRLAPQTRAATTQQLPRQSGSGQGTGGTGNRNSAPGRAPSGARPAGARPRVGRSAPRRVKLTVSRVDPWSVMKISFLISVALGIAGVILMAVIWTLLSGMGVFADVNGIVHDLTQGETNPSTFDLMDYIGFGRVVSLSVVIGVIDIILLTAIATLGAFLYNICASLVGGLQMTLSDD